MKTNQRANISFLPCATYFTLHTSTTQLFKVDRHNNKTASIRPFAVPSVLSLLPAGAPPIILLIIPFHDVSRSAIQYSAL